jgi:hypothetical protein
LAGTPLTPEKQHASSSHFTSFASGIFWTGVVPEPVCPNLVIHECFCTTFFSRVKVHAEPTRLSPVSRLRLVEIQAARTEQQAQMRHGTDMMRSRPTFADIPSFVR